MHVIILAGGSGTRLWPLSREDFPKQFLNFGDNESLLQKAVSRFLRSEWVEEVVVSTNIHYQSIVAQQLEKMGAERKVHILVEPERKNTAPAIAFAVRFLQQSLKASEEAAIFVSTSDHLTEPEEVFMRYIGSIGDAMKTHRIVTFGIKPTKPETGYGYIKIGEKLDLYTYRVERFVEKPDRLRAESYVASGDYYWNTGMFAFTISTFWRELKEHAPDIFFNEEYHRFPEISIDYALMEKTGHLSICPLPVTWSDVGSWDSVYDVLEKDRNQNVRIGNIVDVDTKNCLIIGNKRLITTIGLENLLIVETDDALFISKKGESQRVKGLVQELVRKGKSEGEVHHADRETGNLISH